MNIKQIIKEEIDDFDWAREIKPSINSAEDIKYCLNKPFKLYDTKTGKENPNQAGVMDGIYWIEESEDSPRRYNICWNEYRTKGCVSYWVEEIVENFGGENPYWLWRFVD